MEEVSVLIGRSQSGDKEAREVLIEKNLGLVHHIVKRFLGRGYDPEDLFQIGVIGLMKAIDKFDLKLEVRFSTIFSWPYRQKTLSLPRKKILNYARYKHSISILSTFHRIKIGRASCRERVFGYV